jgi:SET domain-containing protein
MLKHLLTVFPGTYQLYDYSPSRRCDAWNKLDIVASMINHSCDPNAFVVFEGNTLHVRAIRKLAAGEEITQYYTYVDFDVWLRRRDLKSKYFFDCFCKCVALIFLL